MGEKELDKESDGAAVVALVLDLMFGARVRGVAPEAVLARTPEAVRSAVGPGTRLVLVDLQARGALEALELLSAHPNRADARVVAWAPHVMEEAVSAARTAGADEVMARGTFVKALPGLVAEARG